MAKCAYCGKAVKFGNTISHSHRRANRMYKPNLKKVRVLDDKGTPKRVYACSSCLRSGKVTRAK